MTTRSNDEEEMIPLSIPHLGGREGEYLMECVTTNFVSTVGPFVTRFEESLAKATGRKYAVATSSGTTALHLALIIAGVRADDEVAISDLTFIAPANAIRYVGAWPVFIDAEPDYWEMDVAKLADFLENGCERRGGELFNKITGRRVSAILPVDILGHPADLDPIVELAKKYSLRVIEDATESLGAKYRGRWAGSLGEMSALSFNGNKLITCGGGGALVTDSKEYADRARHLSTQAKIDTLEFVHGEVGYNYRLTNIQSAVGLAQMERLDHHVAKKREFRDAYVKGLGGVEGITLMPSAPWADPVFWLYTVLVDEKKYGQSSRALMRRLFANGIDSRPLWQPMHLSPAHRGSFATDCSVATRLNRDAISLPSSVGMTAEQQQRVIEVIQSDSRAEPAPRKTPARTTSVI